MRQTAKFLSVLLIGSLAFIPFGKLKTVIMDIKTLTKKNRLKVLLNRIEDLLWGINAIRETNQEGARVMLLLSKTEDLSWGINGIREINQEDVRVMLLLSRTEDLLWGIHGIREINQEGVRVVLLLNRIEDLSWEIRGISQERARTGLSCQETEEIFTETLDVELSLVTDHFQDGVHQ